MQVLFKQPIDQMEVKDLLSADGYARIVADHLVTYLTPLALFDCPQIRCLPEKIGFTGPDVELGKVHVMLLMVSEMM